MHPAQGTHPATLGMLLHHDRDPERPARMQRREGGQLVGQAAQALRGGRVATPPAVGRGQGQHVGVAPEQPRRSGREKQVGDQRDDRADEQGASGGHVAVATLAVEPDQHHAGHDVVGGGVPEAAEQAQPPRDHEPLVEGALPRQVGGLLEVEQLCGALPRRAQGVTGEEPRGAVGDVEGEDEDELDHARAHAPDHAGRSRLEPPLHAASLLLLPHTPRLPRLTSSAHQVLPWPPPEGLTWGRGPYCRPFGQGRTKG